MPCGPDPDLSSLHVGSGKVCGERVRGQEAGDPILFYLSAIDTFLSSGTQRDAFFLGDRRRRSDTERSLWHRMGSFWYRQLPTAAAPPAQLVSVPTARSFGNRLPFFVF